MLFIVWFKHGKSHWLLRSKRKIERLEGIGSWCKKAMKAGEISIKNKPTKCSPCNQSVIARRPIETMHSFEDLQPIKK